MGTKYGSFAVGDANIDNVMLQLAGVETGYCALTLTNMTSTAVPQIAAGSKIEVGGSLFKFDANETITGSATTGTNYIRLVPSGSSITAAWTTTAPTWSDSKQGWYDGTGAYRYIDTVIYKNGALYYKYPCIFTTRGSTLGVFCSATASFTNTTEAAQTLVYDSTASNTFDVFGCIQGGDITIPYSGLYKIDISAYAAYNGGATATFARLTHSGTTFLSSSTSSQLAIFAYSRSGGSAIRYFSAGDIIKCYAYIYIAAGTPTGSVNINIVKVD